MWLCIPVLENNEGKCMSNLPSLSVHEDGLRPQIDARLFFVKYIVHSTKFCKRQFWSSVKIKHRYCIVNSIEFVFSPNRLVLCNTPTRVNWVVYNPNILYLHLKTPRKRESLGNTGIGFGHSSAHSPLMEFH